MTYTAALLIALTLVCVNCNYEVPEPKIDVTKRCLRVSIPDEDGIEIFAFHGNVNQEMNGLEAGEMSKDVLKKRNGRWVFEKCKMKLRRGDTLYYWLYVQKGGLGYRLDDGVFVFDDSKSAQIIPHHSVTKRQAYDYDDYDHPFHPHPHRRGFWPHHHHRRWHHFHPFPPRERPPHTFHDDSYHPGVYEDARRKSKDEDEDDANRYWGTNDKEGEMPVPDIDVRSG